MKKKRLGFNIAVMGIITSGKDTQVNLLCKKYNLKTVNTGLYTRNLFKEKSPEGDRARKATRNGGALPVDLMKQFLVDQIKNKPSNEDMVFVGGPRLKPEAQLVRKMIKENNQKIFVIYITLPEKEVYKRSLQRMSDKKIKDIYKIYDTKKVVKERIKVHNNQVSKTIKYFNDLKILKKVNGNQSIEKVSRDIEKALDFFKKLNKEE